MGKPRPIEPERYYKLLEAFRVDPGNRSKVAKVTGLPAAMVKAAWERGWPDQGLKAIGSIIAEEQLRARAALWDAEKERILKEAREKAEEENTEHRQHALGLVTNAEMRARERMRKAEAEAEATIERAKVEAAAAMQSIMDSAKTDAARSAVAELELVRNARSAALSISKVLNFVFEGENTSRIAAAITAVVESSEVEARDIVAMVKAIGTLSRDMVQMSQQALEMERQRLGQPVHIVGVQAVEGTVEDAEIATSEATALLVAVKRAAQKKLDESAVVTVGGSGDTGPGGGSVH